MKRHSSVISALMLASCIAALLGHWHLLQNRASDWIEHPISHLSHDDQALEHGFYLCLFALSQALLALRLDHINANSPTRWMQALAVSSALLITSLGYVFTVQNSTLHTVALAVIASLAGILMAALLARSRVHHRRVLPDITNAVFLLVWLLLIPAVLLVDASTIGAYQRCVGLVYAAWLCWTAIMPLGHRNAIQDQPVSEALND